MALTEFSAPTNGWREPGRFEETALRRGQQPNRWSDAALIGAEVETWLSSLSVSRPRTLPDTPFAGPAEARLPGTRRNNWREPLDVGQRG